MRMTKSAAPSTEYPGLFSPHQEPLPGALDGELLYSWCARFHRLSGNSKASTTSQMLFGHATTGLRHDFPGQLGYFGAATGGHLGTLQEIVQARTQFALHALFLDESTRRATESVFQGNDRSQLSRTLGLSRSGQVSLTPLKACPACIGEDRGTVLTGWWRMDHQWPSMYACLKHRCLLNVMANQGRAHWLQEWYLPVELREDQWAEHTEMGQSQVERLIHIARWTEALLHQRDIYFDATLLRHVYLYQAKARGWMTWDGALRFATLRAAFADSHRGLEALPGWEFIKEVGSVNGGFLGLLLRKHPGRRHPLKHVLLMAFLYEEPLDFYAQYENSKLILETEGPAALDRRLTDMQSRLIEMVESEGKSANASCLELGIPTTQGLRLLTRKNVAVHRRPRILTDALKAELEALLRAGTERDEIARRLKLRKAYVKDYLATQPELRNAWEQAAKVQLAARYRAHFLRVLEDNPDVPIKRIRRIGGNGFEWLYRNDREWLAENLPGIWRRPET
ncbi:hypothetical protein CHU94_14450 [Rhodoferax sp. TH121]|nr:hypothetical protein CHU94_14450 [Rhodoferax sp. TH121]